MTHAFTQPAVRLPKGLALIAACLAALHAPAASAAIALNKVIVDLTPAMPPRDDIEVTNTGDERQYVVAEPAIIQSPGKPNESRIEGADPTVTGLLVTPQKLVLEPHESKLVRVALLAPRDQKERVFRLTIKPVAGSVQSEETSLKVFVGYDVLIIARPTTIAGDVTATRAAGTITFHNGSNASVEMADGRQCDAGQGNCTPLPSARLYAGADMSMPIRPGARVEFRVHGARTATKMTF
jgi:P pilus assembly chaperone PapD